MGVRVGWPQETRSADVEPRPHSGFHHMELLRKKQCVEIGIQNILSGGSGNGEETFYEPSCVIICKFIFLSSFHFCATPERSGGRGNRGGRATWFLWFALTFSEGNYGDIIIDSGHVSRKSTTKKVRLMSAEESEERPEERSPAVARRTRRRQQQK